MKDPFESYKHHKNFHKLLTLRLRFTLLRADKVSGRLAVKHYISFVLLTHYERYRTVFGDIPLSAYDMQYFNAVYKWVNARINHKEAISSWTINEIVGYCKQDLKEAKDKNGQHNIQIVPIGQLNRIQ